jgi:hypothetical protein
MSWSGYETSMVLVALAIVGLAAALIIQQAASYRHKVAMDKAQMEAGRMRLELEEKREAWRYELEQLRLSDAQAVALVEQENRQKNSALLIEREHERELTCIRLADKRERDRDAARARPVDHLEFEPKGS